MMEHSNTRPEEDITKTCQAKRKSHKSVEDELAEKRLRMVVKFKREEEEKCDEGGEKENKGMGKDIKRRNSHNSDRKSKHVKKKRTRRSISSDDPKHICTSSCPANHWMMEDEEWIDKDDTSGEDNDTWFPDYSSDTPITSDK